MSASACCRVAVGLVLILASSSRAQRPDVVWQVGGHTFRANDLAYSADGSFAASASNDGTLKLWDMSTGELSLTLAVPPDNFAGAFAITNATFSPFDDTIWGTSVGGAYQWRLGDGALVSSIIAMETAGQVFFSPDGQLLGLAGSPAGSEDATYIYRRSDGALLHMFEPAAAVAAAFTPDSQFVIAGTLLSFQSPAGVIRYYRLSDGGVERTINAHGGGIKWIDVSPDGTIFASCSSDGTAKLWNVADGSPRLTLTGHTSGVDRVKFSPDGANIATSSYDGTMRVWDVQSGVLLDTFSPMDGDGVGAFDYSPDGASILVATGAQFGSPKPTIREIASADGSFIRRLTRIETQFSDISMSPDGSRVAMSGYPGRVAAFDTIDGAGLWSVEGGVLENFIDFSRDSVQLAVGRNDGSVTFLDAATGAEGQTFHPHSSRVVEIGFSPDGELMATRCIGEPVKLWNFPTLTTHLILSSSFSQASGFTFSADSQSIAVATGMTTSLLRTSDVGFIRAFSGHQHSTLALAIRSGNDKLLTASADRTARIWNLATGATLQTLEPHENWVRAAAFSPDGRIAATGTVGGDRSLRLWDVETGELLVRYTIDMGTGPAGIVFTPNGERIICGRGDGVLIAMTNPFAFERGDVNADGAVDVFDADALAAALVGEPIAPGDVQRADVNRDGRADGADVNDWIAILLAP